MPKEEHFVHAYFETHLSRQTRLNGNLESFDGPHLEVLVPGMGQVLPEWLLKDDFPASCLSSKVEG